METMETKVNTTNETESAAHQTGMMDINDFDYDLPEELIAQDPIEDRSSSRLLLLDKKTGKTQDKIFRDIIDELNPGDCLVINNTKVIPARLMGVKEDTGAHIEVLLLKREQDDVWEVLVKPGKKAKPGTIITFGDGRLKAEVLEVVEDGNRKIRFSYQGIFEEILDELGQMPLPPYITHQLEDKNRYQTVYAKHSGSAAAPTAGLHFTPELLEEINRQSARKLDTGKTGFVRIERCIGEPKEGYAHLTGLVEEAEFNGVLTKYVLKCYGQRLKYLEKNDGRRLYTEGEQMDLYVNANDIMQF